MSKEIVKACIKYDNKLYIGFDHGECFQKLNEDNTILVVNKIEQGFVDSDGNFLNRKQAMDVAKKSEQLNYETDKKTLISEDLHLDWLRKQEKQIDDLKEKLLESENCAGMLHHHLTDKAIEIEMLSEEIDDLKQELIEKEKDRDTWKSMAKCGDKLTEKMRNEYQQLKQQLAEKDEQIKRRIAVYEKQFIEQTNENYELKQQLAEKEKEIEDLKEQRRIYLNRSVEECNKITDLEFELQHKHQDKISFAVEQLEKAIKFINEKYQYLLELEKQGNLTEHGKGSKLTNEIVLQKLHNQIEELKKETN